jgi:hypothetical protein
MGTKVGTCEAAKILMMSVGVLRTTYYKNKHVCGIVPEKDRTKYHLKWPKDELIKASIRRQAELAAEWTYDALKTIRDEIRERAQA